MAMSRRSPPAPRVLYNPEPKPSFVGGFYTSSSYSAAHEAFNSQGSNTLAHMLERARAKRAERMQENRTNTQVQYITQINTNLTGEPQDRAAEARTRKERNDSWSYGWGSKALGRIGHYIMTWTTTNNQPVNANMGTKINWDTNASNRLIKTMGAGGFSQPSINPSTAEARLRRK